MENWREAAERYRQVKPPPIQTTQDERFVHAAQELQEFLDSEEGQAALNLLEASNKQIPFCMRMTVDRKVSTAYFMNGNGFRRCCEITDRLATRYADMVYRPEISSITLLEAVEQAFDYNRTNIFECFTNPEDFVPWLRRKLDAIALAAPEPEKKAG